MGNKVTVDEAARITGKSVTTIRNWIRWKWIPATRLGHRYMIDPADLQNVVPKGRPA